MTSERSLTASQFCVGEFISCIFQTIAPSSGNYTLCKTYPLKCYNQQPTFYEQVDNIINQSRPAVLYFLFFCDTVISPLPRSTLTQHHRHLTRLMYCLCVHLLPYLFICLTALYSHVVYVCVYVCVAYVGKIKHIAFILHH